MTRSPTLQSFSNIVLLSNYELVSNFFDCEFFVAVLEIEIVKRIYNCLKTLTVVSVFSHCYWISIWMLVFCFKLAYFLTTSLTLRSSLNIVLFSKYELVFNLFWLRVLHRGPRYWDCKTHLQLLKNFNSCKVFQSLLRFPFKCYFVSN